MQAAGGSDEVVYKIDIPANRYDMLCLEGIARALNIFNDRMATPSFKLADMTGRAPVKHGFPGQGCCWLCSYEAFDLISSLAQRPAWHRRACSLHGHPQQQAGDTQFVISAT